MIHFEQIQVSASQWNSGRRALDINGVYAEIVLWAENDNWGGQRGIEIRVLTDPRNDAFTRLMPPTLSAPPVHPYAAESDEKRKKMQRGLDELTAYVTDWVNRYVLKV